MRILISASIITLASGLAAQAFACDRHGGAFGQLTGASWAEYDPTLAEADTLFLEESLTKWHKENSVPPVDIKPTKPSFSKASSQAAMAAQERMAKKETQIKKQESEASQFMKLGTLLSILPSR
jgi:hypothetical protein